MRPAVHARLRSLGRLGLYARTLAPLRPIQWLYLPWRRFQAHLPARVPVPRVEPRLRGLRPATIRIGIDSDDDLFERADAVVVGSFRFLGHTERIRVPDWRLRYVSHLWSYNFHYFDYARDLARAALETAQDHYANRFLQLACSWARGTEPGRGDGWEPYAVSVRIVNWIYALALLGDALPSDAREEIQVSLARQTGWLERRLEKHIQANHLQKNYQALAIAGLAFEGGPAERWRRIGLRGSWDTLREQVLDDGGHCERSPMYHAIAFADYLELFSFCDAAAEAVPAGARARVRRMADAFGVVCRPDGPIHLFNDAAHGCAPSRGHLDRLARDLLGAGIPAATGLLDLPESGYFGVADANGDRLLIDCGVPGPRDQPAHAHCDLLSFELDIAGEPVVVDSGVHGYAGDVYREYARSTRAHNTVMFTNREQSEMWDVFRVGRMATLRSGEHTLSAEEYRFVGAYSPYHAPRLEHHRRIVRNANRLTVADHVLGGDDASVRSFLHLHPRFQVESLDGAAVLLSGAPRERIRVAWHGVDRVRVGRGSGDPEGWYFPEFGRAQAAAVLVGERTAAADGSSFGYEISWD